MESELIELFEAAKKAADAAAVAGGSTGGPNVDRCVDALKELKGFPVSYDILVSTQVAKRLRHLTKHPIEQIQTVATEVVEIWKKIVIDETIRKKNGSIDTKRSIKVEVTKTETVKVEEGHKAGLVNAEKAGSYSRSESIKVEKKPGSVDTVKSEKIDWSENVKAEKKPKVERHNSGMKVEKSGSFKIDKGDSKNSASYSRSESIKVEKKLGSSDTVKAEKIDSTENGTFEKIPKEEKQNSGMKRPLQASNAPPKLTSMVKCNDAIRDKMRELVVEALSKVSGEADEEFKDEVEACDPIRVAVAVESMMFEKMGRSNGTQKVKYRSIMFNLKDPKNPDLRRKVLLGEVSPEKLINMTPEEMASNQRQRQNDEIKKKVMFDCERASAPKATTDQFKCGRCGQRKCTYYQLQTRSADEPMTTFVTCVNCNNHWKFC